MCRDWIVPKILDHAFHGKAPFKKSAIREAYLTGAADGMIEQIRELFKNMWHAEWEDGQLHGQEEDRPASRGKKRSESGS
jgi:hypothetical protein